jgi:hypothetical protein
MTDAITVLDKISEDAGKLSEVLERIRSKTVLPTVVQPTVRMMAHAYFEIVRPELDAVKQRAGLVDEIDWALQAILQLATATREKEAYIGQIKELRPYLMEATIDLMKARGASRLILSETERAILETLAKMLPLTSPSYEQALRDISQGRRVSWRGTANELREVLREVIDYLAPDDKVMGSPGFQLEKGQSLPTQKQKVRFILKARRSSGAAVTVAEASLATAEEAVAALARSTYQRGNVSAHATTDGSEIRKLKRYVDALLAELLEIT